MIFGSHGATVKPFTDRNEFSEIEHLPATMLFSDPYIMLREKAFLSYVNELYLTGHEIITEELNMYVFELN